MHAQAGTMDELLKDFVTETADHIEAAGSQLVLFERDPSDARLIAGIFRLVHTIKGTCGFLGLPRLSKLAHAAEAMITHLRDGATPGAAHVSLVLSAIDRIKYIISEIDRTAAEPEGDDAALIAALSVRLDSAVRDDDLLRSGASEPVMEASALAMTTPESAPAGERRQETVRVSVNALERMMTLVSELVLTRNQLLELARHRDDEEINAPLQRLSSLTSDLQDGVMRARMQPVGRLFAGLPRLVRELSVDLGKQIELVTTGADTEVDRQIIELIRDPLTHLIRNCADHGIEPASVRRLAGKPETGTIRIGAAHEAGQIVIEIVDDGRGLDLDLIREKAVAQGLATRADIARMSHDEICRFIFAAGFSTAREVTSVSGRGIGMDVVRENLESIGGAVTLSTTAGKGTRFHLKIPLTLAIAPALIVEAAGHRFALPQHCVVEAVGLAGSTGHRIETVQGASLLALRDAMLPVADLRHLLNMQPLADRPDAQGLVVVMRLRQFAFGLRVDAVADVQEIVVKPLGALMGILPLFSGNTILGDGAVVLILDPGGVAASLGLEETEDFRVAPAPEDYVPPVRKTRLILFRAGEGPLKALPLSLITRVEEVRRAEISMSENRLVMPFQGRLMPLAPAGPNVMAHGDSRHPVLVIAVGGEPMGLLVSDITDIIDAELDIQIDGGRPGVLGMAQIQGEAVEIIDAPHFMREARPNAFARGQARRFHVLLVDDKLFFRDMLAPVLLVAGYDVVAAASAREALALFERGMQFDAVVTDTDMPDMDGYAFARTLRARPGLEALPIVALAAYSGPAVHAAAQTCGINAAVGKFDRAALLRTLAQVLDPAMLLGQLLEQRVIAGVAA